jgi:hypothetical protein
MPLKVTGHVGVYKVTESHLFYNEIPMIKGETIICGIVGDPRVMGQIWKGWHKDSEAIEAFNNRDSFFGRKYFSAFGRNQMYLDWSKLERVN